ncbi:MAG: GNAT family N-acetyltransferase [Desulfotignum sp.]
MAGRLKSDPETNIIPIVMDPDPTPPSCRHCALDFFLDLDKVCRWRKKQTDPVCFSVAARLDRVSLPSDLPDMLKQWGNKGLKMIQWQCPNHLSAMPSGLLWQTAKAGIWNHVLGPDLFKKGIDTVPAQFILNHPHVVHSFDLPKDGFPPGMTHAYDDIDPLPGIPFWQTLTGPGDILSCLAKYPASHLARIRWDRGVRLVLGNEIGFYFLSPAELPPGYLDQIHAMVIAGGSVDSAYVRPNLENAFLIGYAMENNKIVGCSCLKHPRDALIRRLRKATGLDFSGCVERGYTSVRPEYRSLGVGRRLLEGLTARSGKYRVFAIIDEDNLATQKIARWNNTRKVATYFSEKTNKQMGIWMPAHMVPAKNACDSGRDHCKKDEIQ